MQAYEKHPGLHTGSHLGTKTVNKDLEASDLVGLRLRRCCELGVTLLALLDELLVAAREVMQLLATHLEASTHMLARKQTNMQQFMPAV